MKRTVTLVLTLFEAEALDSALGNTTTYPDAMESVLVDGRKRNAAYRAAQKLADAIRDAHKVKPVGGDS